MSTPTPTSNDPDRLVSPEGLADHYAVSRAFVYKMLEDGLPSLKLGRARRIRVSDADAWLNTQQDGAA